ncbi:MAG: PAS domain S-box protein [Alphaproteobacteria bacterium]|nr:PAS domain S-box protein [Alphaproteobacteria bacterium]
MELDASDPQDVARAMQQLAAIVASTQDAIISKDLSGTILTWNTAAERIFGYKAEEIVGKSIYTLIPPDRESDEDLILERIRRGERVEHYETVRRRKNGSLIDVAITVSPLFDNEGNVIGASKIARDVSERTLADRSAHHLAAIIESSEDAIISKDTNGIIQTWNQSAERLFGYKPEEIIGKPVLTLIPPERHHEEDTILGKVRRGERIEHFETVRRTKDGRLIDISLTVSPIKDRTGKVIGASKIARDITDKRRAAALLEEQAQRLAALNEELERRVEERTADLRNIQTFYVHSSECHAILSRRPDGRFQYDEVNPATLNLYGMSREQVVGRTTDEVLPPERAAELNAHLEASLQANTPHSYLRKQGDSVVDAVATPIPVEPGQAPRVAVTARDISERQSLEEQLRQAQKMEAVGQLTGGLAHDFNNLLQGIIGALDRAQHRIQQGRASEADRFIGAAIESANRAASLTHRLLAFSRRQTLDPRPTDANRLINGMEDLINRTAGPNIAVEVVGAAGLWLTKVDAPQLESAVLNLAINARDAMPEGGKLTIETANKWLDERAAQDHDIPPGQYVSVCVTDTGVGMPPEVVARAFDPFFTTKPIGQGTGLGLSMVYGFVRQSGGQVRIYTEVGKGTTMCLYLPRYFGDAGEIDAATAHEPDKGFGETVMIVDDEATVRMLVSEVLKENSYRVLEAYDAASAMKVLESGQPVDLLITDVGLPGSMNGRQLADAARVRRPELKVLFITGFAENAAVGNGHLDPGMAILTKPFPMTTLANKVREMLG